jgi:cell division protein FtsB
MKKEWCQWLLVLGSVCLALVLLLDGSSERQIVALQARIQEQKAGNRLQREQITHLKREIYGISHDNRYLEQLARNKLALANEGDVVFLFRNQ